MAAYVAYEPKWVAEGGITGPRTAQLYPAQTAAWRTGDFLTPVTTGSITNPTGGAGSLATAAAPSLGTSPVPFAMTSTSSSQTQGVVTVTAQAASGAPPSTLWFVVTYDITIADESPPSQMFVVNTTAGLTPIINVSASGAPASATHYGVYAGFFPGQYFLQHAVTTLGTVTNITYPLTNSQGVNKATTGISANIIGLADSDSDAYFAGVLGATAGGSQFTGKRSLFGATQSFGPGWPNDAFQLPVTKLQIGLVEITLKQAYWESLNGSATGIAIDSATGYFVADTAQTACATIEDLAYYPGFAGGVGDTGARVKIKMTAGALI